MLDTMAENKDLIVISMEANILAVFSWSYLIHKGSYSLPFHFFPELFFLSESDI